jgi:hypothetical protein
MRVILVVLALTVGFGVAALRTAQAGGTGADELDESDGPVYFGFVRDGSGLGVGSAKVSLAANNVSLVTQTNVLGAFKLAVAGVDPNTAELACSKDGYRQVDTLRRSPPSSDPKASVEIDCTLQREGKK